LGVLGVLVLLGVAVANPEETKIVLALGVIAGIGWIWRQQDGQTREGGRRTSSPGSFGYTSARDAQLGQILDLSPRDFEEFTRRLLSDHGFRDLRLVGGSGDLGVDIVGRDQAGRSVAVQCKRYSPTQRIGSPAIQTFIGMQKIHHGADLGIFVTTSDYTPDAHKLAAQHGIWLVDGNALVRMNNTRGMGSGNQQSRMARVKRAVICSFWCDKP
jgi:restriction system protein